MATNNQRQKVPRKKLLGDGSLAEDQDLPAVEIEKEESFFDSKIFRLFTVCLYLGSVSGLGMMLSIYHLFFWDSAMPILPPNREH